MKYFKYLKYVLKHKWYVMLECFKIGLIGHGIRHDLSKFYPEEFIPYANFFGKIKQRRRKGGYYKPVDTGNKSFDYAWLLHQSRNRHHWQWWVVPEAGVLYPKAINKSNLKEMVCDWIGASKAQGHGISIVQWWKDNNSKMTFHLNTRKKLEKIINKMKEGKKWNKNL